MLEVVAPHFARGLPAETKLLYASFPCVRIQQPCDFHTIRAHVDTMYLHPHGSLNAWLPLTTTRGANTLHVESEPGREDFAPIELSLGELAIFDGARCSHFTVANTSDKRGCRWISGSSPVARTTRARTSRGSRAPARSATTSAGITPSPRKLDRDWIKTIAGTPSVRHGFPHTNPETVEE